MRRIPRDTDEHLPRSVEELFFTPPNEFARCRLCGGSFQAKRWAGHLDYHRELFDEYRPVRAALDRRVKKAENDLMVKMDAAAAKTPTRKQLERHEGLYGRVPADLRAALGAEEKKTPNLPPRMARRLRKRQMVVSA